MLDWNPSEFSRLRAQYDWDDARDDGERDRVLACNTSTASARTARTSIRNHAMKNFIRIVSRC